MSKITHVITSEINYPKRYGYSYSKQNHKSDLKINGLDTETDKGKPFLLGFYLHNGKKGYNIVKSLSDILEILTSKKYQDGINLFYNLTYDVEGILKYFPKSEIIKIYFKHNIEIVKQEDGSFKFIDLSKYKGKKGDFENNRNCYRITYIPSKFLRIKHGHETFNYYDLLQYYSSSLDKAGSKYLKLEKLKVNRELISKDRFFKDKEYKDLMIKYVIRDSEICQKLGDLLFQNIYNVYNSKKFISSASIAEDYITHHVNIHLPKLNREIINAFLSSYHGGRFEILKRGSIPNAKEYDISSAYGKEMAEMPMLTKNCKVMKVFIENPNCLFGTYNIDVKIPTNLYVSPIPFFDKKDNLLKFPTGNFKDFWIDKVELDYLKQQGFKPIVHYGYEIHDDNAEKLLKPIMENAYKKKQYYKSIGDDIKANTYKTITNACFTGDTDILTNKGIINIKDIKIGDIVYSLNPKTLKTELKPVTAIYKRHYIGNMFKILSNRIDFIVTPNHKFLVSKNDEKNNYKFIKTNNLNLHTRWTIPRNTKIEGIKQKYIRIGKQKYNTNDFLELLGWIISEGCFYKIKNQNSYKIEISQHDFKNKKIISNILKQLKIKHRIYKYGICFFNKEMYFYLTKNIHKHAKNKKIPKDLFKLDYSHLQHLYRTLMLGDGYNGLILNKNIKQMKKYSTISKQLSEDFLRLCLHLGLKTKLIKEITKFNPNTKSFKNCGYIYRIYIYQNKSYTYIHRNKTISKVKNFNDYVYNITVKDNHTVYAGRNNLFNPISQSYGKFIQTIREKVFEEVNDIELINKLAKNEVFFINDKIYMGVGGDSYRVGTLFAPFYASYITAKIRVKLLNTLSSLKDTSIHAFHTDSIITDKNIKTGNEMGDWELKQVGNLKLYKSGYYKLGNKTRCRGYSHFNPQKSMQKRRIGLGYAIHNSKIEDLNVIFEKEIAFNLSDNKRAWIKLNQHLEDSKPLKKRNI